MSNYLDELNDSQREAVTYCDGPSLVIAGAGSGKTRVLTYKIAYLMEQGLAPWHILALTFTNKAAREMKERIARLVGAQQAAGLWMGTFHSIFARILRTEAGLIGYDPHFTIYDQDDSRRLIRSLAKEMDLDEKLYKPSAVGGRISSAKNRLMTAADYAADASLAKRDREDGVPAVADLYARYERRCRQANAMDFDDLLLLTYQLLRDHPAGHPRPGDQHVDLPDPEALHQTPGPPAENRQEQKRQKPAQNQHRTGYPLRPVGERQIGEQQQINQRRGEKDPPQLLHRPQCRPRIGDIAVIEPDEYVATDENSDERPHPAICPPADHDILQNHVHDPQRDKWKQRETENVRHHQDQNPNPCRMHYLLPSPGSTGRVFQIT